MFTMFIDELGEHSNFTSFTLFAYKCSEHDLFTPFTTIIMIIMYGTKIMYLNPKSLLR